MTKDIIIGTIIIFVLIVGLFFVAMHGIELHERHECIKMQEEAQEKYNYWITESQDELCRSLGIKIIAPIK